jgi:hypothetical protein
VLSLRQEVGGREVRARGLVGDDHHLARPWKEVDANGAEHLALRLAHERVAGAEDLVHGADRPRAVGHGADRVDSPDPVDLANARQVERGQEVGGHGP